MLASQAGPEVTSGSRTRLALGALLVVAFLLRAILVWNGGQGYWPDEVRYLRSWQLFANLSERNLWEALRTLHASTDHLGFTVVGLALVVPQAVAMAFGPPPVLHSAAGATIWVPALALSLASVASIGLVFALARRAGSGAGEALAAAFLAACTSSLFYYSRHLLPYDIALCANLLALWLGMQRAGGSRRSFATGLVAGGGFLVYYGAWLGSAVASSVHVLAAGTLRQAVPRALLCAAGLAFWPLLFSALTWPVAGPPLLVEMTRFSELARTQSDLSEGWSLPFAYLWHAEHGLLVVFGIGALGVGWGLWRRKEEAWRRGAFWLGVAISVYAAQVLLSNGLGRIGVFGRHVRQALPFLCLATAAAASPLFRRWGRAPRLAACVLLAVQAAWNFATPLAQIFPDRFALAAQARFGTLRPELSLRGPRRSRPAFPVALDEPRIAWDDGATHVLLNAQHLYPVLGSAPTPSGRVLARASHPLAYRPYQYEGYVPSERALLRSADISMRVVELDSAPRSR